MTKVRLLCVESDTGFRVLYHALLQSHGFSVHVTQNSAAALDYFRDAPVQAALIAQDLEGAISGIELAAQFKLRAPELPVVIVSNCESVVEDARHFVDGAICRNASLDSLVVLMKSLTKQEVTASQEIRIGIPVAQLRDRSAVQRAQAFFTSAS